MKKSINIVLVSLTLSGCQGEIPEKMDSKILYDKDGCAFVIRGYVGDTVFLVPLKEVSLDTCKITFGE